MLDPDLLRRWSDLNREPGLRRLHPTTLRAGWWAWTALRRARRDLAARGFDAEVPQPPRLPWGARTGVNGVLARASPTCLERSYVERGWLHSHGIDTEIVIGVRSTEAGAVEAHAWIAELTPPGEFDEYRVIHRIPAGG